MYENSYYNTKKRDSINRCPTAGKKFMAVDCRLNAMQLLFAWQKKKTFPVIFRLPRRLFSMPDTEPEGMSNVTFAIFVIYVVSIFVVPWDWLLFFSAVSLCVFFSPLWPVSSSKKKKKRVQPDDDADSSSIFWTKYTMGRELGSGMAAVVYSATRVSDGHAVAVKKIDRTRLPAASQNRLFVEVDILKSCHHKNIYKLFDVVEEGDSVYLVLELVEGGELFDRICEKEFYSESDARQCVRVVLEALCYLHRNDIAHRDVKPENLCCVDVLDDTAVKLVDFGLATRVGPSECKREFCGTGMYAPPEVFREQHTSQKMDVWATGIVTYILLCGQPPFESDDHLMTKLEFLAHASGGDVKNIWDDVSEEAKSFVRGLLNPDVDKRPTAAAALKHEWMQGETVPKKHLRHSQCNIKTFQSQKRLRAAVKAVSALHKFKNISGALHSHETHCHSHPFSHSSSKRSTPSTISSSTRSSRRTWEETKKTQ